MAELETAPLEELAILLSGGTPSKTEPAYWNGPVPWLTPKDMGQWDGSTKETVSTDAIGNGTRLAPEGTIFIAVRGMSLHNEIRIVRSDAALTFNQDIKAIVPKDGVDGRFLYYALLAKKIELLGAVEAAGHGTGRLPTDRLQSLAIPCLSSSDQRAVSQLLGTLDNKIELNRRMNETLEAMARAILQDWFVDFGPTRAKMEGRAPYLAPDIWSLFPDRLDDEGKPEGWRAGKLSDVAQQVGQTVSPETLDPNTPYIGLEHMPRRSIALSDWAGAGKVTSGKLAFKKHDFLFGKLRPYFHKVGIAPLDGICSTDIVVLNAREQSAGAFVLACISQDEFVAFTDRTSDGTKMPRTSWSRMERYGVCLPNGAALEAFNALANPMLERIVANIHESRTLAATRDLLLPKLMSGEVRVSKASAAVEHRLAEAR